MTRDADWPVRVVNNKIEIEHWGVTFVLTESHARRMALEILQKTNSLSPGCVGCRDIYFNCLRQGTDNCAEREVSEITTPITPEALAAAGYQLFTWNRVIPEYWKSFSKSGNGFDYRVGVRFGEQKGVPFTVYLVFPYQLHPLRHITTVEQVEQLVAIMAGEAR